MAWTMGSGKATRFLGWVVPTLAALLAPTTIAQQTDTVVPPAGVKRLVIVSVPDRKLVVMESGAVLRVFSVAVGADVSTSPTGAFEVVLAFRSGETSGERARLGLTGLVSLALAAVFAIQPDIGAETLAQVYGLFSIVSGI